MKQHRIYLFFKRFSVTSSAIIVTLDWNPNTNHIGLYVAKQYNFFKQENLDVRIVQSPQTNAVQMVAAENAQFGIAFTNDVYQARNRNIGITSIAAILQQNTACFAWRSSTSIKTPKDFEGKRYGGWGAPEEEATLKYLVTKAGGDFHKVKMISTGIMDFVDATPRHADFMWIYLGWEGVRAQLADIAFSYICPKDLDPAFDTHSPLIITSDKLIKKDTLLIKKFLNAVSKGYTLAAQHPDQAAMALLKQVPELDSKLVTASAKYLAPEFTRNTPHWGIQKAKVWQAYGTWLTSEKLIEKPNSLNGYFTNEFLPSSESKR